MIKKKISIVRTFILTGLKIAFSHTFIIVVIPFVSSFDVYDVMPAGYSRTQMDHDGVQVICCIFFSVHNAGNIQGLSIFHFSTNFGRLVVMLKSGQL